MQRRFRQVMWSLKEKSSVSYARVATVGGFCDVEHILVKATTPDDLPMPDRYVVELLKIFSISPSSLRAFPASLSRRLNKTRCWRVAVKCLLLLHRLLRSLPHDHRMTISLHPCHFQDSSSSSLSLSLSYTRFVRSYAHFLDDAFSTDLEETMLPQLQRLMERAVACRPEGTPARNPTVQAAMRQVVRDSFTCYATFRRGMVLVLESLFQMPYRDCIAAFGIYKKAAAQAIELGELYDWGRSVGLCGVYEYPFIDRIPQIQIQVLDTFLNGMWQQQTDSEEEELAVTTNSKWEKFEQDQVEKERALIEWGDNESWEDLLEAAVNLYTNNSNSLVLYTNDSTGNGNGNGNGNGCGEDEWKIQLYNSTPTPTPTPFYDSGNPLYPWGL